MNVAFGFLLSNLLPNCMSLEMLYKIRHDMAIIQVITTVSIKIKHTVHINVVNKNNELITIMLLANVSSQITRSY